MSKTRTATVELHAATPAQLPLPPPTLLVDEVEDDEDVEETPPETGHELWRTVVIQGVPTSGY